MSVGLLNSFVFAKPYDPDAVAMFDARANIGDEPSSQYKRAISDCVEEIKSISGFWNNIIQLVVMAGAATIDGACVAIKGAPLTPFNLVNGDIALKTGAKGNGTNKYLRTNYSGRPSGTDQNNFHTYCYLTEPNTSSGSRTIYGHGAAASGRAVMVHETAANNTRFRDNNAASASPTVAGCTTGGHGMSRVGSTEFTSLVDGTLRTHTANSVTPSNGPHYILVRGPDSGTTPVAGSFANARVLVWALGSGLDLTQYNTPIDNLVVALNAI